MPEENNEEKVEVKHASLWEFVLATFSGAILNLLGDHPINRSLHYLCNSYLPNKIPDEASLVYGVHVGWIDNIKYYETMRMLGYSEVSAELIRQSIKPKLSPEIILRLKWRGLIQGNEFDENSELGKTLREHGINPDYFVLYEQANKFLPPPSDLIRFSVRDVYYPEVIKKYGMDKEFPEKFVEEAKKLGMDEEVARKYWIAHWELPSISAVFEMLHRLPKDMPRERFKKYEEMG